MNGAARLWSTTQWRRRWPTFALAWFVLALTGALALGAATTARRAVSAFDRLRQQTFAAEVTVNSVELDGLGEDVTIEEAFRRLLPLIDAAGATYQYQYFIFPVGFELMPTYDFIPLVQHQLLDHPTNIPVVITGRMPNPDSPNEIALSQQLADLFGLGRGDTLTVESASSDWLYRSFSTADPGPKDGPTIDLVVTGIVVSPLDFSSPSGTIYMSSAFGDAYGDEVGSFPGAEILVDDEDRVAQMIQTGSPNSGDALLDQAFAVGQSRWGDQQQVGDGLRVVAVALWIFVGAVAVAGLSAVALIVRRMARSQAAEIEVLSALGVGRLGRASLGALLMAPVIVLAGIAALAGALVVAPFARIGLAEQVEPDRGVAFDWPALIVGLIILVVATLICTVPPLRHPRSTEPRVRNGGQKPAVRSPLPVVLGIRDALDFRGAGRNALAPAAILMTTVVASLVVGASLTLLPARPMLWGGGSDVVVDFGERGAGETNFAYNEALRTLANDERAVAVTGTSTFFPEIEGKGVAAFALDSRRGDPIVTIINGHSPRNADEAVMGRATMRRHHLQLGDSVELSVAGQSEAFRVVGQAVFPVGDVASFGDSLAITREGAQRFTEINSDSGSNQILITWAEDVDDAQARRDLAAAGYRVLDRPRLPPAVTNLTQVDDVPILLASFFGALGIATLGYMLGAFSRSRGRQFAVLATLGLRPRQVASILRWQAITVAAGAVAFGIPAGIVVGRVIWNTIGNRAGVAVSYSTPIADLALTSGALLLAALTIAVALASRTRRRRLTVLLRAD